MVQELSISERRACRYAGLSRTSYREPPSMNESTANLSTRIVELAHERRRFGYRRIHDLLALEGRQVNHKRVWRLYKLATAVDHGMGGEYVVRLLDQAAQSLAIRTDQGPEFTSRAFMAWTAARGVRHLLNDAGCPTQNAYIESFNGKFRDECLNGQWFETLVQARQEVARWRRDYNEVRPHSSLGRIPPASFAALHRQRAGDARQSPEIK